MTLMVLSLYSSTALGAGSGYYRHVEGSQSVIVFVHGLFGDAQSTWTAANGAYWPDLIAKDKIFENYSVYVYEYSTSMASNVFSIDETAANMRLYLDADGVSVHKDILFIAHSMGGLVTRAYLLENRAAALNTRLIYFYSTPTTGSQVAAIASLISTNPQLSKLQPMQSADYLADLQRHWLAAAYGIPSFCAYETKSTYGFNVVTQASASNLCNRRLDPLDADHITIVKPENSRDPRYLAFRVAVGETPIGTPSPPLGAGGGRAEVIGNRSRAIGGSAGESGIAPGGPGGDAIVHGDDSLAIGGQGGGAPQANGKGGRGGIAALGLGYGTILPDGHRLSDFGRGGAGANTPEYERTHWSVLTVDEMVAIYSNLRLEEPQRVHVVCADDNCLDLAESFVDLFGRLRWPDVTITYGQLNSTNSISVSPDNSTTHQLSSVIARITGDRIVLTPRHYFEGETDVTIGIGKKS